MAKPKSPTTILNFLKTAKTAYQKAKPDPKSKPELRHKEIVKDLQRLKVMAAKKASGEAPAKLAKPFEARKRLLLKKITAHRKSLNSGAEQNKDPNKAQLTAYIKKLLKLTVAVLGLEFATVTTAPDALDLNTLEEGNQAELDRLDALSDDEARALESEDNLAIEASEEEEVEGQEGQPVSEGSTTTEKPQPKLDAKASIEVVKKFLSLKGPFDQAVARKGPQVAQLQAQHERIRELLDGKEFAEAAAALPALEALINTAQKGGPTTEGPGRAVVGWQAARVEATNTLRRLEALVAKTRHPLAGQTVTVIENVVKRLAAEVKTKQQAADLTKYLEGDADVSDLESTPVEGTTYSIRPALLKALQALQGQLPT